jgi:SAM-dependent methyltransferase
MAADGTPDQFYTGLIAQAYAPLRGAVAPSATYERFVRKWGEPALEIGCGHGEPLLDLVAAGLNVTGLDSSADMLSLCRAEAERRGLCVTLLCQRMQELATDERFASIYFAGPTFQLVVDPDAALGALQRIAMHLRADGRALVPLFVPTPVDPDSFGIWREHVTESGEVLALQTVDQSYRPREGRVDTTLRYRRGTVEEPIEVVDRVWSLRWYNDDAFADLAKEAGLAVDREIDHGQFGRSFILRLVTSRAAASR